VAGQRHLGLQDYRRIFLIPFVGGRRDRDITTYDTIVLWKRFVESRELVGRHSKGNNDVKTSEARCEVNVMAVFTAPSAPKALSDILMFLNKFDHWNQVRDR
jgi:hypothetical protein